MEKDFSAELSSIEAKSFYVYDLLAKKSLFAKDEHKKLPLASITKLMTGFVVLDMLPSTTTVVITKEDIQSEGDSGLLVSEKWKLKDLLDFSLIISSNDGMHALSRTLNSYIGSHGSSTIQLMNNKAKTLGYTDTFFVNETGLDVDEFVSGSYSSAHDISLLLEKIMEENPELLSKTVNDATTFVSQSNINHRAINTDTLINKIPNILASKTGFTDLAGGNLIVAFDAGFMHPIIIAVLGSTEDGRFTDVEKLMNLSLEKLSE